MDLFGNTFFDGPAGSIEAILKEPASAVIRVAVICHPHPLYGGTMHNKVVYRIARAFYNAGIATLRFNFRGAGKSAGIHDNGVGEQDDLIAALDFVERKYPDARVWLGGFSFGASIAMRVGCRRDLAHAPVLAGLVAAGLPVSTQQFSPEPCGKRKLFIQGSLDQFGSVEDMTRFFQSQPEPKQLVVVEGADHFFEGHLDELEQAISGFIYRSSA